MKGTECVRPFRQRRRASSQRKRSKVRLLSWYAHESRREPKDPTIREKFDTYRFADYKEKLIALLMRVTTVSVETVKLVEAMKIR